LDSSRLRTGEIVAGIAGVALFVFPFFDWFAAGEEGFDTGGVSGWDGFGTDVTGFIVFLAAAAGPALAYGAFIALAACIAIAFGGFRALQEESAGGI
jgi:hypothetical protein